MSPSSSRSSSAPHPFCSLALPPHSFRPPHPFATTTTTWEMWQRIHHVIVIVVNPHPFAHTPCLFVPASTGRTRLTHSWTTRQRVDWDRRNVANGGDCDVNEGGKDGAASAPCRDSKRVETDAAPIRGCTPNLLKLELCCLTLTAHCTLYYGFR